MTINRITDTPMLINSYNSRGLISNHAVTKNCVRQSDGTLWAILGDWSAKIQVVRSTDNGFSWSVIFDDVESGNDMRERVDFNVDGLFTYLIIDERWRNIDVYMGEWENIGGDGSLERKRYQLDDLTAAASNTTVLSTTNDPYQGGSFDISYNHEQAFITWIRSTGILQVTRASGRSTDISPDLALGAPTGHFGFVSSCCDKDGNVHIASTWLDGGDRKISYIPYDATTPSFGTPVLIEDMGASPAIAKDVSIAIDGLGTLCIVYFDQGDEEIRYATSIDSGTTWDLNTLTRTLFADVFNDSPTSDAAGRTTVLGGALGGFLLSYVEDNAVNVPKTHIRELTTSDGGSTYDLQNEKTVATSEAPSAPVTGLHWFLPPDIKLLDISDPGLVRVAYNVGEGDSLTMSDTIPVTFEQELLFASAYPSSLTSEASSYSIDTADPVSLLVLLDIHAGPESNIDFYSAGMTGGFTDKYISAFNEIGTSIRLLKYEPDADNYMNDRSAYQAPSEESALALFDPVTYSFPSPSLNRDTSIEYVEQDVRKMHLPPTQHLARTFLVNKGGHLKRTVWTCEYDGNEYEVSQIIPRFISNQICYYECNAYVIGPSRDPFSRTVLPSET